MDTQVLKAYNILTELQSADNGPSLLIMCMCGHVHTYVCTCVNACVHVCVHSCVGACRDPEAHMCVNAYVHLCVHVRVGACRDQSHMCAYACTCMCSCLYACMCMCLQRPEEADPSGTRVTYSVNYLIQVLESKLGFSGRTLNH